MLPILIAGAGLYLWHKHQSKARRPAPAPAKALAAHGFLMGAEWNPEKLEHAARKFSSQGLPSQAQDLKNKAKQVRAQISAIPDLCKRARTNDQNAIAMIAAVREEAACGVPRAKFSAHLIEQFCLANPAPPTGPLGELPQEAA